jgi:uncharacterized membrane protein (UPF0127 family)
VKVRGLIAILAAVVLLLAGCGSDDKAPRAAEPATGATSAKPLPRDTVNVRVGDAVVRAEVAREASQLSRGLGGRARLARNAGMYFVLAYDSPRFWMKGMRIPLDMIWIKSGRVVDLSADVPKPPPGAKESQLPTYSPSHPANRVLEVNAGWAARNGVQVGDAVRLAKSGSG